EDQQDHPPRNLVAAARGRRERPWRADAVERHVAPLRDAPDDALDAGDEPRTVSAAAELRYHHLTARLARESVRDPLLERVADFDPDLVLLDRDENQQAVVLALLPDPLAVILEELVRVLADVAVRLERRHSRHDDDVAGGRHQLTRDLIE